MARIVTDGFAELPEQPIGDTIVGPRLRMCSCATVNGVHHENPQCQVHGDGKPGTTQITVIDPVTGEIIFHA